MMCSRYAQSVRQRGVSQAVVKSSCHRETHRNPLLHAARISCGESCPLINNVEKRRVAKGGDACGVVKFSIAKQHYSVALTERAERCRKRTVQQKAKCQSPVRPLVSWEPFCVKITPSPFYSIIQKEAAQAKQVSRLWHSFRLACSPIVRRYPIYIRLNSSPH